jgi:hypothetical protein
VGLLDTLLGRTKPVKADLDRLFALPPAQITLQVRELLLPTGQAGICFKPATGPGFGDAEREIRDLLALDDANDLDGTAPPALAAAGTASPPAGVDPHPARPADAQAGSVTSSLTESSDEYGYRWIVLESADFENLVTRAHFVNSTLDEHGWSSQLLCSVFGFGQQPAGDSEAATAPGPATLYLVYLYKRGSFYPFVPLGGERRDNEAELRLKAELAGDLPIEPELDRWFPIWKLPLR